MTSTIIEERTYVDDGADRRRTRVSWGALFAGAVVAIASWVLLYAFGLAIGLSSVSPGEDLSALKAAGIGTGIWGIIAPLIALFLGGFVAARLSSTDRKGDGFLHGLVVWGVTTIAGLALVGMLLSNLVGSVIGIGKTAVQGATVAGAAAAAAPADATESGPPGSGALAALGLDYDALIAPVNQRLQAQGMSAITADQMKAAVQDAVPGMVAAGSFDREKMISAISANTALDRAEAEQVAAQVETSYAAARTNFAAAAEDKAMAAADTTGKAFWGVSLALLLGMISAGLGGIVGAGNARRRLRRREAETVAYTRPATTGAI